MIGIIVAEEKELVEVKKIITNIKEKEIYEKTFYIGEIDGSRVVCDKSNFCKVNAASICEVLIYHHSSLLSR